MPIKAESLELELMHLYLNKQTNPSKWFFLASLAAYGSSQARNGIPAIAATYTTAVAVLDP